MSFFRNRNESSNTNQPIVGATDEPNTESHALAAESPWSSVSSMWSFGSGSSKSHSKSRKTKRRRSKSTPLMRRNHHATFAHLIHDALLRLNCWPRDDHRGYSKRRIAQNIERHYRLKLGRKFHKRLQLSLSRLVQEHKLIPHGNKRAGIVYKPSPSFAAHYERLKVIDGGANRRFGVSISRSRSRSGSGSRSRTRKRRRRKSGSLRNSWTSSPRGKGAHSDDSRGLTAWLWPKRSSKNSASARNRRSKPTRRVNKKSRGRGWRRLFGPTSSRKGRNLKRSSRTRSGRSRTRRNFKGQRRHGYSRSQSSSWGPSGEFGASGVTHRHGSSPGSPSIKYPPSRRSLIPTGSCTGAGDDPVPMAELSDDSGDDGRDDSQDLDDEDLNENPELDNQDGEEQDETKRLSSSRQGYRQMREKELQDHSRLRDCNPLEKRKGLFQRLGDRIRHTFSSSRANFESEAATPQRGSRQWPPSSNTAGRSSRSYESESRNDWTPDENDSPTNETGTPVSPRLVHLLRE